MISESPTAPCCFTQQGFIEYLLSSNCLKSDSLKFDFMTRNLEENNKYGNNIKKHTLMRKLNKVQYC